MGKFHQFLTELPAHDMIMAGYYHFTFYCCCVDIGFRSVTFAGMH